MIDYDESWLVSLLFRRSGSVSLRSCLFAVPAAALAVLLLFLDDWAPGTREDLGLMGINESQIWVAATGVVLLLLNFRTSQALARFWEGTGLLHQMRAEWFDTVSNCFSFTTAAKEKKPTEVDAFRHTLVRLTSLAHGRALEEISGRSVQVDSIDVWGLDKATIAHVRECRDIYHFNQVEVIMHLVQSIITKAQEEQLLSVPPPILSRVYQTISRGFVHWLNAKKITDTRFPFPYAQLIAILLFALEFLTPMIFTALIDSKILAALFCFVPIFGLHSLNMIAIQLEDPFGTDDNDLPLNHFQGEMNRSLLMLLHSTSDLIATISPNCVRDFQDLHFTFEDSLRESVHSSQSVGQRMRALSKVSTRSFGRRLTHFGNGVDSEAMAPDAMSSRSTASVAASIRTIGYRNRSQRLSNYKAEDSVAPGRHSGARGRASTASPKPGSSPRPSRGHSPRPGKRGSSGPPKVAPAPAEPPGPSVDHRHSSPSPGRHRQPPEPLQEEPPGLHLMTQQEREQALSTLMRERGRRHSEGIKRNAVVFRGRELRDLVMPPGGFFSDDGSGEAGSPQTPELPPVAASSSDDGVRPMPPPWPSPALEQAVPAPPPRPRLPIDSRRDATGGTQPEAAHFGPGGIPGTIPPQGEAAEGGEAAAAAAAAAAAVTVAGREGRRGGGGGASPSLGHPFARPWPEPAAGDAAAGQGSGVGGAYDEGPRRRPPMDPSLQNRIRAPPGGPAAARASSASSGSSERSGNSSVFAPLSQGLRSMKPVLR